MFNPLRYIKRCLIKSAELSFYLRKATAIDEIQLQRT